MVATVSEAEAGSKSQRGYRMIAYLDAGSSSMLLGVVVAGGAAAATAARVGWKKTAGKLSPKQRKLEEEKRAAAEAAEADEADDAEELDAEPETTSASD